MAQKAPNELGLYDMSGNLWKWCWDKDGKYTGDTVTNPTEPESAEDNFFRAIRGGGWQSSRSSCQIKHRCWYNLGEGTKFDGLRVCRSMGAR